MTSVETAPTVAITESTLNELDAMRFAFMGELMPDQEQNAYADELIAMMLGYELRKVNRPTEKLARVIMRELMNRMFMTTKSAEYAQFYGRRRNITGGIARPGFLLDSRGLDVDTLTTLAVRREFVESFAALVSHLDDSYALRNTNRVLLSVFRDYTDQQIIDLVIWSAFAHPLNGEVIENEYPWHIEDEIRRRVPGHPFVDSPRETCAIVDDGSDWEI